MQARDLRVPRQAARSFVVPRPTLIRSPWRSRSRICCSRSPSRNTRNGRPAALGLDAVAQLGRRGAVGLEGRGVRSSERSRYPRVKRTPPGGPDPPPGVDGSRRPPGAPCGHDRRPAPPDRLPHRLRRAARRARPLRRRPRLRRHPRPLRGARCTPTRASSSAARTTTPRRSSRTRSSAPCAPCAPTTARWRSRPGSTRSSATGARRPPPPGPHDRHRAPRADAPRHRRPTRASASSAAEELGALVAGLKGLPERQRTALVLHEMGGASHQTIAERLAVTTGGSQGARLPRPRGPGGRARGRLSAGQARRASVRPSACSRGVGSRKTCQTEGTSRRSSSSISAVMRSTSSPEHSSSTSTCAATSSWSGASTIVKRSPTSTTPGWRR